MGHAPMGMLLLDILSGAKRSLRHYSICEVYSSAASIAHLQSRHRVGIAEKRVALGVPYP